MYSCPFGKKHGTRDISESLLLAIMLFVKDKTKLFGILLCAMPLVSFAFAANTPNLPAPVPPLLPATNQSVFRPQQPSRFELYRSYQHAEAIMKSPAFQTQDPNTGNMNFSVAGSYLENLHSNLGIQSESEFANMLSHSLQHGQLELFIENSRRTTLVLQILDSQKLARPSMIASIGQRKPGGITWPLVTGTISSPFGMRWGRMHNGIDIAAPFATPIYAAGNGVVVTSGFIDGYGLTIEVRHTNQLVTRYAHCGYSNVRIGQPIRQGDFIGNIGLTGNTTGPHLHFEILVNNSQVDPLRFGF